MEQIKTTKLKFVQKRDGRLVAFNPEKIVTAITKAQKAVGYQDIDEATKITKKVIEVLELIFKGDNAPTVENIQDLVEKFLIESGNADVAKRYILYRHQHAQLRDIKALFKGAIDIVDSYITKNDWRVKENSNMSFSLQGLNNHISSTITQYYWLHKIYPEEVREAHISGDFHIHDLGLLSVYCCGWDLQDLLFRGFGGVSGKIESKPPKHFKSALGQIVNFFYTMQGEAAGAQAFANFDTYLAPFVAYDNLSYKEVKQAMQEFIFNLNIPTRVGFQTPFTNITMDLKVPKHMQNQPAIIGGQFWGDHVYGDFQKEMNMINRAFAEVMMEGDAKGRIFTFPIPTYNISKDFEWENEDLNPIWEMTGKYGIPYFANFVNSDMDPEDARSMCCRLRLDNRELRKRGGGLFGSNPLTGSIGVVTINLPRIAYLSNSEEEFFERLSALMDIAKESLEIKRKVLTRFTEEGLYPYSKVYLEAIKKRQGDYWANHFSTIGLVGMNEACLNLFKEDIASTKGREFAVRVLKFMRERILTYQEETGNLYNLEATPAEGTSYRLAKKDKEKFPDIITSGEKEPYYTNSSQLGVNATDDIFEALEHQDELQSLYTGGTVLHVFLGEKIDDVDNVKNLVRTIASNYTLPYFSLTPTFSICPKHGYIPGEHPECPICKAEKEEQLKLEIKKLEEQLAILNSTTN